MYESYLTKLAGSTQNPKKNIGTPIQNLKKNVSYLNRKNEPKICMRATRQNLHDQPKILKKLLEHQINQSE
jgi:hypothetical protein